MKADVLAVATCLAAGVAVLSAATIREIKLADGSDEANRIVEPIYDTSGIPSVMLTMAAGYDRKPNFVRRVPASFMAPKGPEYDLDPKVDLAALLTEALNKEAGAMGLSRADASGTSWRVSGTLKQIYLESRQVYMGATLFYGYMDIELQVTSPIGRAQPGHMRVHTYSGGYNAGFGRRDEAAEAAAHLLVDGAQEILARLNREFFKAPAHREMNARLNRVRASGSNASPADLRMISLSGLSAAAPVLLAMISQESDENLRTRLIDSLALLGSSEAVELLAARYATEDEDCRFYTLKAMDYIGGPEANRLVTTLGIKDKDTGPRRLATRIAAKPPK